MQKKLWFKAKRYGWGWTPSSWEGWVAIIVYAVLLTHVIRHIIVLSETGKFEGVTSLIYIGRILLLTAAIILVCYLRGEKPGWHWGEK